MTDNQSDRSSEPIVVKVILGEQAPRDMNTPNSSSNQWEVRLSTSDIEIRHHRTIRGKTGVFACRDLPQDYEITGAEESIFVALPLTWFPPVRRLPDNFNALASVCLGRFKKARGCLDADVTSAFHNSLVTNINHACPNCAQATFIVAQTYDITLTLVKDVRAGEEIFVDFGQVGLRPTCSLCKTRESPWKWGKRRFKGFVAKLNRRMSRTAQRLE